MATPHQQSELLYGLLAQQMNFITRDQLLEAANIWFNQAEQSLADLLRQLGHMNEEDSSVVAEAVEMHRSPEGTDTPTADAAAVSEEIREALLELRPPATLKQWLIGLKARKRTALVIEEHARAERYRLGAEIGRGGLGKVMEAFDRDLHREVAVKLVLDSANPALAERFLREARLTSRLDHPNVVPIHDFGKMPGPDGETGLYLCMKRIRGEDLGALLQKVAGGDLEARAKWSRARLLRVLQDICLGVAYAHAKGVVHRDLKPSNVMIGAFGETLIVDWGLAKEAGEEEAGAGVGAGAGAEGDSDVSVDGDVIGTPAYMSPEQAEGRLDLVDARSDVYALGAILYAMLTLRPPHDGRTASEVLDNLRSGKLLKPSTRVDSARASLPVQGVAAPSSREALEHVPPELDAICLRAMAFRREDRYPGALDLHDDLQLFLEGVKERERAAKEAAAAVAEGNAALARFRSLKAEVEEQERRAKKVKDAIPTFAPVEEQRAIWAEEERLKALEEERVELYAAGLAAFARALAAEPANAAAADGNCELHFDRFLGAERAKNSADMLLERRAIEQHDRRGAYRARLEEQGRLSIRAMRYDCGCLKPVSNPAWSVTFDATTHIPWRDGRPVPSEPLAEDDLAVPAVRTSPAGVRFGHGPECVKRELAGVVVTVAMYEERDRRLVLGSERDLGVTPILNVELPQGSYRCTLRGPDADPVLLPVSIERGRAWSQDVTVYRRGEIPPYFVHVPAGLFKHGGEQAGGGVEKLKLARDMFVARFPVTCAEYLEFLNHLCAAGMEAEARDRCPRDVGRLRWIVEGGRFRLPLPGEDARLAWDSRWPVFSVNWFDAMAYCAWRSGRDGLLYTLPHDEEYEKAGRGVDGRSYTYGNTYEAKHAHCGSSLEKIVPMPVGTFEADESPYGIRDMSGGCQCWVLNTGHGQYRDWRILKGGSWSSAGSGARIASKVGSLPNNVFWSLGFRMVCRPEAYPPV